MQGGLRYALFALLAGCNTCLDASTVPFSGDVEQLDMATADGTDRDGFEPDADCLPESDEVFCTRVGAQCGSVSQPDNCGAARTVSDCGECGAEAQCAANSCACEDGYALDGLDCVDIDECAEGSDDCEDGENCSNLPGTFQCSACPAGFLDVDGDGMNCVDIDECETGIDNCADESICTNNEGSFDCGACPAGYVDENQDGTACVDIDECAESTDNCDANATCTNSAGAFACACNEGWMGDGMRCADVDECADGDTNNCAPVGSICTNSAGSFDCACTAGFRGDGVTCTQANFIEKIFPIAQHLSSGIAFVTTPSFDPAKTVPFVSMRTDCADFEGRFVRANPQSSGQVVFQRQSCSGDADVVAQFVEFDEANVQRGFFAFGDNAFVHTISLPTAVDPAKSLLVFSFYETTGTADSPAELMLQGELAQNEITLRRGGLGGPVGLAGNWWVVEAIDDQMTVQHQNIAFSGTTLCGSATFNAVSMNESFVLHSTRFFNPGPVSTEAGPSCELINPTTVECCRFAAANANDAIDINVQLVSFAPGLGSVQRGETVMQDGDNNETETVAATGGHVMPWLGGISPAASAAEPTGTDDEHAYVAVDLFGSQLSLERDTPSNGDVRVTWEVIQWPD